MKSELGLAAAKMAVPLLVPRLIYYFYYYYYYYYCPASSTTSTTTTTTTTTALPHPPPTSPAWTPFLPFHATHFSLHRSHWCQQIFSSTLLLSFSSLLLLCRPIIFFFLACTKKICSFSVIFSSFPSLFLFTSPPLNKYFPTNRHYRITQKNLQSLLSLVWLTLQIIVPHISAKAHLT